MSLIPSDSNPYLGAFAGGLLYGLAVCTASCLPYLAGYIAGVGGGFRRSVGITAIFNTGRIAGYAIVGGLFGLFSGIFSLFVSNNEFSPFQTYSSLAFGIVTIIIGTSIILKSKSTSHECSPPNVKSTVATQNSRWHRFDIRAFSLGLSRGLILCPPLVALLIYSLPFSTPLGSVALALAFGSGTVISPLFFLGGVTGWLLNKAPLLRKWISIGGAAILIILGLISIINSLIHF